MNEIVIVCARIISLLLIFDLKEGDKFWRMPECYIRGNTIKYLRIPEDVMNLVKEEDADLKNARDKSRGRMGRGRGRGRMFGGRGGNRSGQRGVGRGGHHNNRGRGNRNQRGGGMKKR